MISHRWLHLVVAFGFIATACHDSCPPGYVLSEHVCLPVTPTNSEQDASSVEPEVTTDADAGTGSSCDESTFGTVCITSTDCGCDTGFCAAYPEQAGVCTHTGCIEDPTVCPSNWTCMDLPAYHLSVCTPP